jgi:hypothetical protein
MSTPELRRVSKVCGQGLSGQKQPFDYTWQQAEVPGAWRSGGARHARQLRLLEGGPGTDARTRDASAAAPARHG